jgi:hypothetical protein
LPPEARGSGLLPFEVPLLKALSSAAISTDVDFRAGVFLLKPSPEGTAASVIVEVPMHGLQAQSNPQGKSPGVHFAHCVLIKNAAGEVIQKLTRDRSFQVTAEQLKGGNFVDKMPTAIPPGAYTLESAVMDLESGKIGTARSEFTVAANTTGVGISSLAAVRAYAPNAKNIEPAEPFQFQGGIVTLTLNTSVSHAPDSLLRLFFTVYQDLSRSAKPTVEIQLIQAGKTLQKVPLPLPAADAEGRIPYVMTIPAAAIPPGTYQMRAVAHQGATTAQSATSVTIEAK